MSCPTCGKDVLDIDVKCGSCGAILGASGAHRMLGTMMLGQYELVDVLGQGGMSVVFKGRHNLTQQEVALKILPPELAAHSQVKSRFLDEAKMLAALDHPNIVHLYNFGQDNGYFVLAMQLVQGRTWERMIIESRRLDWTASCRIAIDVLRALEYAHDRGVIHRDMKPSNVLVRARDGVATVMDFGIAKMTTSTRLTATGQTMGTVRYMSPEQVRGQDIDLRTDIYSLGATLYESLTGETPFDGSTHFDIMTKHLSEPPRRPSKLGATIPLEIEDAVMRCLAKRSEDRFDSARELRKVLEAALRDADVGLIETQKLAREKPGVAGPVATALGAPTGRLAPGEAGDSSTTTGLADALEPGTGPRRTRRIVPWIAVALALVMAGGAAALWLRAGGYRATVEIAGVALTRGIAVDNLRVETDGAIEPAELAELYATTLRALRAYARGTAGALEIADPVDVLLAVPARALCEPTAYLDRQPPNGCASALSATAIGAKGTRRLMVVSDRARLIAAVRRGVAQAACDFSPVDDDQLVRQICDVATRFAESPN
jgi:tRNA A-37 threonylcarbamoyl transferase component Bud32